MVLKELTNQEFDNFVCKYKLKSIYQTKEYGFVMNEENLDSVFLGLGDKEIKAATLILIDKESKYAYAPRGFLIDYNNYALLETFTKEIKKYLNKIGVMAIKLCPIIKKNDKDYETKIQNLKKLGYKHLGFNNNFEALKPRFEASISFDEPYYLLFQNIKKEFRTKIRTAEKTGIKIYKGHLDNLDYLYEHTKRKYPRELKYFKNLYKFFGSNAEFYYAKLDPVKYLKLASKNLEEQEKIVNKLNMDLIMSKNVLNLKMRNDIILNEYKTNLVNATRLVSKYPDGIILASILIIKQDDKVYSIIDGHNPKFRNFNAKHLLIWKLIEKYSKLGFKEFNLGGITNPESANEKFAGLNRFKLSFDADVIEYVGDYELIANKPLYLLNKNKIHNKNILKK